MRWPLGLHIAVVLVLAVAAAITVLALLWMTLGAPRTQASGPLKPSDTYDAIKIAPAVVAGLGGVVALVVAYRRQHLSEATDAREYDKALIERFGAAAEQLGADQPAVRMAGAYAMARLADEWPQERQMCIDVLCGYLRMPHAPDPPTDDEALAAWQREREVRVTVLGLIATHLRDGAPASWRGHDLDFTGAAFTGSTVNFGGHQLPSIYRTAPPAQFSGATVDLSQVADFTHPPQFGLQALPPGLRLPSGTNISDLP